MTQLAPTSRHSPADGRSRRHATALRSRLPYLGFRAAEATVGRLPHRLGYATAVVAGSAALKLAPHRFDALRSNLRQVLPDASDRQLRGVLRRNVRNLARSWVDVLQMPHRGDEIAAQVHPVAVENMTRPLARGRGVVTVSLHLGCWELGLAAWNRRFGHMALLAERLRPDELFAHIVGSRESMGVSVIPIDTAAMRDGDPAAARRLGAAAARDVMRALRANQIVAMAVDRDLIGNGEPMPFLGGLAPIPLGVVELAIRAGAAIVPVILIRAGDEVVAPCWPEIAYDPDAERQAEVRRVATDVLRIFEQVIREHPDQWHVLAPVFGAEARVEA